jgi:hypothetical protein
MVHRSHLSYLSWGVFVFIGNCAVHQFKVEQLVRWLGL